MNNFNAFIIRLKGQSLSENLGNECLLSGNLYGLNLGFFDGIYGEENIENASKKFNVRPFKEKMKKGRLGVKGCLLSHYSLWLQSIELNTPFLICEHDAVVVNQITEDLFDFDDVLILDPYDKFSSKYENLHKESRNNTQRIIEYSNPNFRKKLGVKDEYPKGTHGYLIKPKAAMKLKCTIEKYGYLPADAQLNKSVVKLQTVTKPIISVNPKYINNKKLMDEESFTQKRWVK